MPTRAWTTVADVLGDADVLVDFTQPDTALQNALDAVAAGVHVVIGTTGFDPEPLRGGDAFRGHGRPTSSSPPTSPSAPC